MRDRRGHHCKKRPVWRYKNNDFGACKRCYHQVWHATRARLRAYHTTLDLLECGDLPASLAASGQTVEAMARAVWEEVQDTVWQTGAKHDVPPLLRRCARLLGVLRPPEAASGDLDV